jgi:tyrosine-protein phosphatase YwqE
MTVSLTAFSQQSLSPKKKLIENGDTLRCWSVSQARAIAKIIQSEMYCDSVITAMEKDKADLKKSADFYAELYQTSEQKVSNLEQAVTNQKMINANNQKIIEDKKKEVKKQKFQKWLATIGMLATTGLAILR